jgi:hypothetical protein
MKYFYTLTLSVLLLAGNAFAQAIPNGSFESWGSDGNPDGWITNNAAPILVTVSRSSTHTDGAFAAHGEVIEFLPGQAAPPLLMSGRAEAPGFPINARPGALNGFVTTDLKGGDVFYVTVSLMKGQEPVGGNSLAISTSSSSFIPFSLPILYANEMVPDTAIIMIMIGNDGAPSPSGGSSFTVDALAFGAGTGSVGDQLSTLDLQVVDHGSYHQVEFSLPQMGHASLEVIDMNGRQVSSLFSGTTAGEKLRWEASGLANGIYLCRLATSEGTVTRTLSVVR